jgi:hypothetical protein
MFDFGTTPGQVVEQNRTNIRTSNGQAVVPINKHIQTLENEKNNNKQTNFKILDFEDMENGTKQKASVPYQDNLKTKKHKDYNQPL